MTYLSIDTISKVWRPLCAFLASAKANLQIEIQSKNYLIAFSQNGRLIISTVYSLVVALSLSQLGCLIYHFRAN